MTAPGEAFAKGSDLFKALIDAAKELKGKIIFVSAAGNGASCGCMQLMLVSHWCPGVCCLLSPIALAGRPRPAAIAQHE